MSAYGALAASYDALTYDIPYEKIAGFWQKLLARYGCRPHTVLDLACGTGSLSALLALQGYQVLGVDASEDMLTQAMEKTGDMENAPYYICQKMQRLRLPIPVDAAVCCLDSINYLIKPDHCRQTLQRVYRALAPGGVFVFDINTPFKLENLDGQVFLDETEDTYCVWRAEYDRKRRLCRYGMDLFQRDEDQDVWYRSAEEHDEYAYTPEELTAWLDEAGFVKIRQYGDLVLRAPREGEQRIYFSAQKPKE